MSKLKFGDIIKKKTFAASLPDWTLGNEREKDTKHTKNLSMDSNFHEGLKARFKFLSLLTLVLLAAFASAQNTAAFRPEHVYRAQPGISAPNVSHRSEAPSTNCQTTDLALDYSTYNEIQAGQLGISYDGSWNNIVNVYANQLSSLLNRVESDSFGSYTYAGVVFDTLGFGNYSTSTNTSIAFANTTVYLDSLKFFGGLSGDSTRMTNDSLVFTIYSVTNNVPAIVKTILYKGKSQLDQFFLPSGYLAPYTIPVHYQFTQGQSFMVKVNFQQQDTSGHFLLAYSYPDSCGTIVFGGNTYTSPAHMSSFPATSFWAYQKDTLTNSVIPSYQNSAYAYNLTGIPLNCSFVYPQNWEIIPLVTYCTSVAQAAPTVVTNAASSVAQTSATLNGSVNANGASSTTGFQWGPTTAYAGGTVVGVPSPVTGSTATAITYALSGLTANTTYHFRALGTNTGGTTYGSDMTFTTLSSVVSSSCDTVFNMISPSDIPYLISVGVTNDSGWVNGNNRYDDLIKAEGFPSVLGDHVTSAVLDFGLVRIKSTDSSNLIKILVWDNTGTDAFGTPGAPGHAIDSATVSLGNIAYAIGSGYAIQVNFTGQVALTTDTFYVGAVLPTTLGDTLVVAMDIGNDGDGWEYNPTFGGWASYVNDWGFSQAAGNYIEAIQCPAQQNAQCTPAPGAPAGISPAASSVPCVTQGTAYTETYTIVVPTSVTVQGVPLTVTSITVDSIGNLPSGLTWMANANPATYAAGTSGCYIISGTSNAACGEYLTPIYITAVTSGGTFHTTLDVAGYPNQFLQVIASPNTCPVLNTNQTTPFVADANCGVSAVTGVTITTTAVPCRGQASGSAVAHATGGNGTYTYLWSNGATTSSITNVVSGTYTVTVTSNSVTATASATISQPATALQLTPSSTSTGCSANTGTAAANASGGTAGYTYHWSNGSTAASLTGLAAATYTLTVTDANGCSTTGTTTVSTPTPFSVSTSVTAVACFGQSTGGASATASGASGNLTYHWSNSATGQSISNVAAGNYTVTITDANGCTGTASASVTQPASALIASASATITACGSNTGTATVTATGGTTNYAYVWSNNGTTGTISSLGVGNYTVTVTDAHSCTASAATSVNTSATYVVNVTSTSVNCFGQSTGTATATVTGATGNVTYLWSNGGTASTVSSLTAGTYNLTVTDGSGCSKTGSTTVTQPLTALSASVTTTQTACSSNTGTATAIATGGTVTYTYNWSNSTTANPATSLPAGAINLTVTDSKGCTVTATATVNRPAAFSVSTSVTAVGCYGQNTGSVTATVSGSSNDTYFWSNGGTSSAISNVAAGSYTVTVTDGSGCSATGTGTVTQPSTGVTASTTTVPQSSCLTANGSATVNASNGSSPYSYLWSNSSANQTITNLAAGNYTVTVSDNNHCTASAVASVNSPASFTIAVTTTNVLCYGANTGSATVTVTGTGSYTYLWNNSVTLATNANLTAGTYNVTVTDANGCSKASSGVVTQPATALVANATATNSTCGTSSGTVSVTAVGGTGSPSYVWSANASSATTSSVTNLGVGVYSVTVTEGGCTATASAIVNNLNGPTLSLLSSNPNCPGGADGSASAVASGGTSPYTYTWSNSLTTTSITGLSSGTYTLIVADNSGCQVVGSVTITAPAVIALNPTIVNESCQGDQNGSISLAVTGGTSPYSYSWSNGNSTPSIGGLSAGGVTVTVSDSKQCTAVSSLTVTQPSAIQISTSSTDATNGADGSASATVTGGTAPYQYSWTGSQTTSTASGLAVGTYTVTVTDANHCTATASAVVMTTGINGIEGNITNISMIPNPANDQVKIVVSLSTDQTVEFRLVDITGKYIYTAHESVVQGSITHQINLSQYASGIYLVEIAVGNEVIRKKLVVAR